MNLENIRVLFQRYESDAERWFEGSMGLLASLWCAKIREWSRAILQDYPHPQYFIWNLLTFIWIW